MLLEQDFKLVLMTAGISIALTSLVVTMLFRWKDNRKVLKINYGTQAILSDRNGSNDFKFSYMQLDIKILNESKSNIFIFRPNVKTSTVINGTDVYQFLNFEDRTKYPLKLEAGELHTFSMPISDFHEGFKKYVSLNEKIRFQISDNREVNYLSKKIKFSEVVSHLETEKLMSSPKA
jgi:hypothetical protein